MSEAVVIIRPSFKKICGDDDACRAAIFNQMLYSIAWKVKQGGDYWYGTAKDIWQAIDRSWGLSKVIQEVKALVQRGLLGQQHNPKQRFDQTYQYVFGVEQAQKLRISCEEQGICLEELNLPSDVLHLLKITNAMSNSNKSNAQNQQIDLPESPLPFGRTNRAIPKGSSQDSFKENKTKEPSAPTGAEGGVSLFEEKEEETGLTVEAVLDLAAQYLPPLPLAINKKQREANSERWQQAAETLASLEYYRSLSPEDALAQFEKLLRYVTDPESPSWWVQKFPQKSQNRLSLWHIAEHEAGIRADMVTRCWHTPEENTSFEATIREIESRQWQEREPGVEPQERDNPVTQSLNLYDAQVLKERIEKEESWLKVEIKPHRHWSFRRALEVSDSNGTVYTLGSVEDWEELHAAIEAWNAQQMQEAM